MGRKPKLTKEIQASLVENISLGLTVEDSCALVPVSHTAFYNWLNRGQNENAPRLYVDFVDAIKKAEFNRKKVLLGRIYHAGRGGKQIVEKKTVSRTLPDGKTIVIEETTTVRELQPDWKADAWLLERKNPDEFGRKYQIDVTDWRKQAEKAGVDKVQIENAFNELVGKFAEGIPRGDAGGGAEGGAATK